MLYNYCPKCGGKLEEEKESLYLCTKCGYEFHINPIPTVVALIINKNKEVLLVRRAKDPGRGKWDIAGGFLDVNETLEEGLNRELKEELNLNLTDFKYLHSIPHRYLYNGVNEYLIGITFVVELTKDVKLTSQDDIDAAKFFPLIEIPWSDLAFPSVKTALEDFINRGRSSGS